MVKVIMSNIMFTIESLEGFSFIVKLARTDANKQYSESCYIYNKYGLDYLKDAISEKIGIESVCQQLVCDEELTISSQLIGLENKRITLLVKPTITVSFSEVGYFGRFHTYEIEKQMVARGDNSSPICYLFSESGLPTITAIGQSRDYLRVNISTLPKSYLKSKDFSPIGSLALFKTDYQIKSEDPKYGWLRYDKTFMKLE